MFIRELSMDSLSKDAEICALAEAQKAAGNEFFRSSHFAEARVKYTEAIELVEPLVERNVVPTQIHIYLCNRAFCELKLENLGSAILDTERAISFNPRFSKAYYRRGCALFCLGSLVKAQKDFKRVIDLSGGKDADAQTRFKECEKLLRSQAFARAIRTEKGNLVSEIIRKEGIDNLFEVSCSYKGPVYEKGSVGDDFILELMEFLKDPNTRLPSRYVYAMVLDLIDDIKHLTPLVNVKVPDDGELTVCGDVHGQFYDLCNIFETNGMPGVDNPYLFNGDYVDRGSFSVEVILLLIASKLVYPDYVHLTRGNHETSDMNEYYGFKGEVLAKYDLRLYQLFCECFRLLPLCFVINDSVFVVHGGLSRSDGVTLRDINKIDRNKEPGDDMLMTDLLWSDPSPVPGRSPSKRGVACQFGPDVTKKFLEENNLKLMIRSHEMKDEGYEVEHDGKLVTVFSAPNYCDQMGNKGAFIRLNGKDLIPKFTQFAAVEHPPTKPMQYANPFIRSM